MIKNERGFALPMVLILVTALSILGMTLLGVSVSQASRTVYQEKKEQAFYIAKSGADAIASYIIENYNPVTLTTTAISTLNHDYLDQDIYLGQGTFRAEVTTGAPLNPYTIIVKSTAKVGNVTNQATLTLEPDAPIVSMNHAIFASQNINITSTSQTTINNGGSVVAGGIIHEPLNPNNKIKFPAGGGPPQSGYPTENFPPIIPFHNTDSWPIEPVGAKINKSGRYKDPSPAESVSFNIEITNNKDLYIVFDQFKPSSAIINISGTGDGIINIYANTIDIASSFTIYNLSNKKVILYVSDTIDFVGSFNLHGVLLYAPEAEYTATNGSTSITGAMVTKNLSLNGATEVNYDANIANLISETRKFKKVKWSN
ncbi:pilus assembly PilX N-terminal domain-containing protein [Paenibacillus faecalis]|uniref:pilus assembly PilX N-terminal domain-containing protein n=1 Tax=Paenibacillus faecalis TaxID=2079532 RepID=UPI000D0F089A|nr:pilus assembly PilX N-terminal domain-containing protein [Paenibacillus faecalis]